MLDKNTTVNLPSVIPPVVANAILTSGNQIFFIDDVDWVGDSYVLHEFEDYKIVDSAQKLQRNQFKEGTQAFVDANEELLNFQQEINFKKKVVCL